MRNDCNEVNAADGVIKTRGAVGLTVNDVGGIVSSKCDILIGQMRGKSSGAVDDEFTRDINTGLTDCNELALAFGILRNNELSNNVDDVDDDNDGNDNAVVAFALLITERLYLST